MKKVMIFVILTMVVRFAFGQFSTYHFEGVEYFAFDWTIGEEPTTSHHFFEVDFEKLGYTHIDIQFEDGKTDLVNSKDDIIGYVPYTLDKRPIDVVTVNSGVIFVSTTNGIYNLQTGEMLSGIEGYMTGPNGYIRIDYDPTLNRLYFAGGKIEGFGFIDFESGMTTFYADSEDFPDFGIESMKIVGDKVYIGATDLWVYDVATEEFGSIPGVPEFFGVIEIMLMDNGTIFIGGVHPATLTYLMVWIEDGEYQNEYLSIIGAPIYHNGQYFLSGSAGPEDDGYFHYFDPVTGVTSPVIASGVKVEYSLARVSLINDEFWFYALQGGGNVMGVYGYYGYDVVRLTDDVVVGINETMNSSFTIYPNPATTWIKIDSIYPDTTLWMIDALGNQIPISWIDPNTIDVSFLPVGIYFLNREKLIIQR